MILLFIGAPLWLSFSWCPLTIPAGRRGWFFRLARPGGRWLPARSRPRGTASCYLHGRGETLELTRIGLFTHVQSWSREDLAAIRVVRELRKQYDHRPARPYPDALGLGCRALQIHPGTGRPVVFSGIYGMLRAARRRRSGNGCDMPSARRSMCRREPVTGATETLVWFAPRLTHSAQCSAQTKAQTKLSRTSATFTYRTRCAAQTPSRKPIAVSTPPAKGKAEPVCCASNMLKVLLATALRWGIEPSQVIWQTAAFGRNQTGTASCHSAPAKALADSHFWQTSIPDQC